MTFRLLDKRVAVWNKCSAAIAQAVKDIVTALNTQYKTSGFFCSDLDGRVMSGLGVGSPSDIAYNITFNDNPSRGETDDDGDVVLTEVVVNDDHVRVTMPGGYYQTLEINASLSSIDIRRCIEKGFAESLSFNVLKQLKAIL